MNRVTGDIDTTTESPITGTVTDFTRAIYSTICGEDDGCYRRAAQRVVTTSAPTMLPGFSTTIPTHREECTEEEIEVAACQNGGTCFAIKLGETRQPACRCPPERSGRHCRSYAIEPFESRDRDIRTAHIAAGFSVFILIVFALLVALYVWHRLRKRNPTRNSAECDPLNEKGQIPPGDGPVSCEYPAPTAALSSADGVGSLNGISTSASVSAHHHPSEETIRLNIINDNSDHNKQLGHSDAS